MTDAWKFYREPGRDPEVVQLERCFWVAHYSDGTILKQFDDNFVFHQFKEIQQDRLIAFSMARADAPPIMIHWAPGRKLIHFYRNIKLHVGGEDEVFIRLYCFGYETAHDKMILAIMPDDSIRVLDDIDKLEIT